MPVSDYCLSLEAEKDHLIANFPHFNFEGTAYHIDKAQANTIAPSLKLNEFKDVNVAGSVNKRLSVITLP